MSGLVSYSSSVEDENHDVECSEANKQNFPSKSDNTGFSTIDQNKARDNPTEVEKSSAPLIGPSLDSQANTKSMLEEDSTFAYLSPYSKNRAVLRNLTLPSLESYEVPQLPPGSPSESTNSKIQNFLELKKCGVHFNQKLIKSTAFKNPSLIERLLNFTAIDQAGQYSTTLPKSQWDPTIFPSYAFKEELRETQLQILKKKEEEKSLKQKEKIEFTPATRQNS